MSLKKTAIALGNALALCSLAQAQWTTNPFDNTNVAIGSNVATTQGSGPGPEPHVGDDRARVSILDLYGPAGDSRENWHPLLVGLEVRERLSKDSTLDSPVGHSNYAIWGNAVREFDAFQEEFGIALGVGGSAAIITKEGQAEPNYASGDKSPYSTAVGVAGDVRFADQAYGAGVSGQLPLGGLRYGYVANATGGQFAILGENIHFRNPATDYSAEYAYDKAVGVRAQYLSGHHNQTTVWHPSAGYLYGAHVKDFAGIEVSAQLNATYNPGGSYHSSGSYDKIDNYVGIQVKAPVKTTSDTLQATRQSRANTAFGTAVGLKIEPPIAATSPSNIVETVTPSQYVGLECAAPAKFTSSLSLGGGAEMTKHYSAAAALDYPTINSNQTQTLTLTVPGAAVGDFADAQPTDSTLLEDGIIKNAVQVTAANTVSIKLYNSKGVSVNPASRNWRAVVTRYN